MSGMGPSKPHRRDCCTGSIVALLPHKFASIPSASTQSHQDFITMGNVEMALVQPEAVKDPSLAGDLTLQVEQAFHMPDAHVSVEISIRNSEQGPCSDAVPGHMGMSASQGCAGSRGTGSQPHARVGEGLPSWQGKSGFEPFNRGAAGGGSIEPPKLWGVSIEPPKLWGGGQ